MEIGESWQTGFTCFKIIGWGRYYLSTVLDDFCRHIIAWILTGTMSADDVKRTVKLAEEKTGIKGGRLSAVPGYFPTTVLPSTRPRPITSKTISSNISW